MQNSTIHTSKKDWWIVLIIVGTAIVLAVVALQQISTRGFTQPPTWITLGAFIFYTAIVSIFAFPVSYEIKPPDLLIRSGLTRSRIPLDAIEAVKPTRNPLSAPALSLDRLQIDYRKKDKIAFNLISPQDKTAFLKELVEKTEGLQLQEDGLTVTRG